MFALFVFNLFGYFRFLIIAYNILEISSNREYNSFCNSWEISCSLDKKLVSAEHSNTEPLAITKKFLLSFTLSLALPSAMFSMILRLALPNWFLAYWGILLSSLTKRYTI